MQCSAVLKRCNELKQLWHSRAVLRLGSPARRTNHVAMGSHVFVVDDDPALGRLSTILLQSEGFVVSAFNSASDALAKLADSSYPNPAGIVLDLNMPDMDGREFYRRAREVGYTSPVLILSAYGAHAAQQELGAEAALSKPFDPEVLTGTLRSMLQISPADEIG
jgi:DNA-binding response OmpR family regulator